MRAHCLHSIVLIWALLVLISTVSAADSKRQVWRQRSNSRTGLFTTKNYFVTEGVSLNVSGLYYFGDVDNEGVAFHGGFNLNNLSLGGGLQFSYQIPAGNHCNIRFGIMGGTLRGNNEEKFKSLPDPRDDYRRFHSVVIQPSVGVQYYPFTNAGFYLYAGIGVSARISMD